MVEHHSLLNTLDSLGFRGHFHTLLKNYLSNRLFSIKNSDHEYQITRAVPQGSILSPILFSLYVNDFNTIHADTIQYADDTTFVISYNDDEHLFQIIKKIERNLIIYTEKTEIILFKDNKLKSIQFLNKQIHISDQSKFQEYSTHISSKRLFRIWERSCVKFHTLQTKKQKKWFSTLLLFLKFYFPFLL